MPAAAARVRARAEAPIARAAHARIHRSSEPERFARKTKSGPAVQRVTSPFGIARVSALSSLRPQRATRVSSPSDPAEREAEMTARRIMQMPDPVSIARTSTRRRMDVNPVSGGAPAAAAMRRVHTPVIHRASADGIVADPSYADPDTSSQIEASMAGGSVLPGSVRAFMEPRFGADFSGVRMHADETSQRLASRLGARAFAYRNHIFFGKGEFRPQTDDGAELIAHELTHTIQQEAVVQREVQAEVAVRPDTPAAVQREPARVQRLGLSDILDGLADLAANVPGFTLLTLIIGRNPINMRAVERNAVNVLRAFMGTIPGGEILFQVLNRYGVIQRLGDWVNGQVEAMGLTFQSIRDQFTRFTDSLGLSDLFSPSGVWRRAQDIFAPTITRIRSFVSGLVTQAIAWLKETFMQPLSDFCRQIPGYGLVTVLLGRDPFTNVPVDRSALNIVRAFAEFIPDGTEKVNQLVQSHALERAYQWFIAETTARNLTWSRVTGTFAAAWDSLHLEDVLHPIDTLQRMITLFRPLLTDLVGFAGAALLKLLEFIYEAAMGAGGARILAIIKRARSTFTIIINDPVGFLRNLLGAVAQGVRQFMSNILVHLRDGVIAWLAGPVARSGIQIPERWDLRGIIWFVLQILGLTWPRVREKLVRLMGERAVGLLESGFQLLLDIRDRGLVQALRDRVTEFFGSLRDAALGAIRNFIQQRLVMAGIQQLLSLLSPVGAIIQAIIKTYTTIQFFIQKINDILDVVESIVDSIAAIAAGAIGQAANFVERTMARTIPVVLDFLARFIGLGDVGSQVQGTIRSIQARVDGMLDRAVDWIRRQASALASRALGGDPNATPQDRLNNGLRDGVAAVNRLSGSRVGIELIRPVLAVVRLRYNMQSLDAVAVNGVWQVQGRVNPSGSAASNKQAGAGGATNDGSTQALAIPLAWVKPPVSQYPQISIYNPGAVQTAYNAGRPLPASTARVTRGPSSSTQLVNGNTMGVANATSLQLRVGATFQAQAQVSGNTQKDQMNRVLGTYYGYDRAVGPGAPRDNDHIWEKQLGGPDAYPNLWPLNESTNRSSGSTVRAEVSRIRGALGLPSLAGRWIKLVQPGTNGTGGGT